MIYYILAYVLCAAIYNQWLLRDMNHYIADSDEDKEFDAFRKTHSEEEIRNIKKNMYKGLSVILSLFWPIMLIGDAILYIRYMMNEPKE